MIDPHQVQENNSQPWAHFVCLAALISALVLYFNGLETDSLFLAAWKDFGHFLVFGVSTYFLLSVIQIVPHTKHINLKHRLCLAFSVALLFGGLIELIQPYFGRSRSLIDVLYDASGAFVACLVYLFAQGTFHSVKGAGINFLIALICTVVCALALASPAYYFWLEHRVETRLPILLDFESRDQVALIAPNMGGKLTLTTAPPEWLGNSSQVLNIHFAASEYPGARMHSMWPNWSDYRYLNMEIFNPNTQTLSLSIRINDRSHNQEYADRYNLTRPIEPGHNVLHISLETIEQAPAGRKMNLAQVEQVIWFMRGEEQKKDEASKTLYLDNVALEK